MLSDSELPGIPTALRPLLLEAAAGARLALVGGAVRDLLLHRVHNDPWRGLPDLDLVVEGSAADLVQSLQQLLQLSRSAESRSPWPGSQLVAAQEHGAYGTVELELEVAGQAVLLDLASARRETYPQPGENPVVSFGSLESDLARRDFTINAMALELGAGQLLDPHGGQQDLQQRQLRFLHAGSVADDPTRLVRGARYAARLGFALAPEALEQARGTLAAWPWSWRPGDPPGQAPPALGTRLRMELELLLAREPWPQALEALQHWGALGLLDTQLQSDRGWRRRLRWAERLGLPLLVALVAGAADPVALAERLQLPHRQHKLLVQWLELRRRWQQLEEASALASTPAAETPSGWGAPQWCHWLEAPGLSPDAVALELAFARGGGPAAFALPPRRPLLRWWLRWRHLKAPLSAAQVMAAEGLRPGPALGQRLRQLRRQVLEHERP
ncbi:MAG: CCA tRNA nucleotidyltransferase [Cyanobacteria bacterium K_Offshore_0m_m2_072]|nr:CCA tRNA nucleotidyltransferase [Cyanobacteria bacterium K_Offshore_0m_m2_072]